MFAGEDSRRIVAFAQREIARAVSADLREARILPAKIEELFLVPDAVHPECGDVLRVRIGKRIEDERTSDAEYRRRPTDAECECQHREHRVGRAAAQAAQ